MRRLVPWPIETGTFFVQKISMSAQDAAANVSAEDAASLESLPQQPTGIRYWLHHIRYLTNNLPRDESIAHEYHLYLQQRAKDHAQCQQWKHELINSSPVVSFMIQELAKLGCKMDIEKDLRCTECDERKSGGFMPPTLSPEEDMPIVHDVVSVEERKVGCVSNVHRSPGGIILCQNRLTSRLHTEDTLAHELIHVYDYCRFKMNWLDLKHHACAEIRAASLSGDCRYTREFMRGFGGKFVKQHQECVRRRAVLSVSQNPNCKTKEDAERAVDEVFEACFADTRPFDEIY